MLASSLFKEIVNTLGGHFPMTKIENILNSLDWFSSYFPLNVQRLAKSYAKKFYDYAESEVWVYILSIIDQ